MFDKIKEECGVFGVYSKKPEKLAYITCVGLSGLQHRGEESCGIASCKRGAPQMSIRKQFNRNRQR